MNTSSNQRKRAFTLVEMIVVIAVMAMLVSMILPALSKPHRRVREYLCVGNLRDIGVGYQIWSRDNGGLPPFQQTVARGGWADLLTNANQGPNCWTNYALLENDLGQSPVGVLCPLDERTRATSFANTTSAASPVAFNDTTVSYFIGMGSDFGSPDSVLGGDRNLGSGSKPDRNYGFSPKDGKGNDVAIPLTEPVTWSLKMHSAGNTHGAGNILLGDGSVKSVSSVTFNHDWLRNTLPTTNWPTGHAPSSPSVRLVFP